MAGGVRRAGATGGGGSGSEAEAGPSAAEEGGRPCAGCGAAGGFWEGMVGGARGAGGASASGAGGGTGSGTAPAGWAEESESLSLPCWGLGMLGEELRLSWSMSLVSLLPSS